MKTIVANAIEVTAATKRVLLVPWGDVKRTDGKTYLVDDTSGRKVLENFRALKRDVVIDYHHHTLKNGGPTGKAVAAGWIKDLEVVPNEGIFGQVEWTGPAQEHLAKKEFRYLSPVLGMEDETTRRVDEIVNASLTNDPAIIGFPALCERPSPARESASLDERSHSMTYPVWLAKVKEITASETRAEADRLKELNELMAQAPAATAAEANERPLADALLTIANEAGEDAAPLAEAAKGGQIEAISKGLRTLLERMKKPVGFVKAAELNEANQRIAALEGKLTGLELERLIEANANRLPPTEVEDFRELYGKDPAYARKWLERQPERVNSRAATEANSRPAGGGDRAALIQAAVREYDDNRKVIACERDEFVAETLREKGLPAMTEDERKKL